MMLRELIGGKCLCDATCIILWYIVYVGPWVLVWKSLKPWGRHFDVGVWGWSCPWVLVPKDTRLVLPLVMSPKRHGIWLALGWCPGIVIIILIECLVEHWYLPCRLLGVSNLSVVKGWMGKAMMKPTNTCIHIWHDYTFVNCYEMFIMHVIKRLIQGF